MSKAKLFQKISNVMGKVERVPKNGWNSFHKYKFVQESDLVDHARKFMVEEGLVVFNNVKEYEIKNDIAIVTVEMTLCDTETGESITSVIVAEGQDKGDKKFPKAYASATKYFLMKTFLIPTGDDPERDSENPNNYQQPPKQQPKQNNRQGKTGTTQQKSKTVGNDNLEMEQMLYFNKLKSKWELYAGTQKGFSGWYAIKQKEGLTNKEIFHLFMKQIESREKEQEPEQDKIG